MIVNIAKASAVYFGLVFAAGFVLGAIRVSWAVPYFGERPAELIETPIMLVAIFFAARFTTKHIAQSLSSSSLFVVGCVALCLLLLVEFTVVLAIRGMTVAEYLASRDPVSGTVYVISLALFAIMPLVVSIHLGRGR